MRKRGNLGPFIKYLGKFRTFFKNLQKLGKLGPVGKPAFSISNSIFSSRDKMCPKTKQLF